MTTIGLDTSVVPAYVSGMSTKHEQIEIPQAQLVEALGVNVLAFQAWQLAGVVGEDGVDFTRTDGGHRRYRLSAFLRTGVVASFQRLTESRRLAFENADLQVLAKQLARVVRHGTGSLRSDLSEAPGYWLVIDRLAGGGLKIQPVAGAGVPKAFSPNGAIVLSLWPLVEAARKAFPEEVAK